MAASLGTNSADGNGVVRVFIDDKPSTIGANNRTWYDGLAWAINTAAYSTNLSYAVAGNTLSLSWPASHLGWILQQQTNSVSIGLGTNWIDLPGTAGLVATNVSINRAASPTFFRLRHP